LIAIGVSAKIDSAATIAALAAIPICTRYFLPRSASQQERFGFDSADHSVMEYCDPIERLQREQMGRRFAISVAPPTDSGTL
jgi:hypothetical protein